MRNDAFIGADGADDNDLLVDYINDGKANTFQLSSTGGAMDVFVSMDGVNFTTDALSLADLGASTTDPVLVTAANRAYGFVGLYKRVRVRQNGATAVTDPVLMYGDI